MSINLLLFSNADCEWRIVAANTSHIIQMVVEDTSIEYHADCVYDAAEVYDGKLYAKLIANSHLNGQACEIFANASFKHPC